MNQWQWLLATSVALVGLYLGYRRLRHAQATARVVELCVYTKPDSPSTYAKAIRWLKTPKRGYFASIKMKYIEPFVWVRIPGQGERGFQPKVNSRSKRR